MAIWQKIRYGANAAEDSEIGIQTRPHKLKPAKPTGLLTDDQIAEYEAVAAEVGLGSADMAVEKFRLFLARHDIPVFNLAEVIAYMDRAARREGNGWHWCPVRNKDAAVPLAFGTSGRNQAKTVDSDYYLSYGSGSHHPYFQVYSRTIPLHVLKKIALIERGYPDRVVFFISDYSPAPRTEPDPFLMAVIPNSAVARGKGRFVIDVWDEPGFGIDSRIK